MNPASLAQHYLRYVTLGAPADNAPTGAHVLNSATPSGCRQLLWEAVFGIANKRGVPTLEKDALRNWLLSYPKALALVDKVFEASKTKMTLTEATDKAYRAEYLALCDRFHKHAQEYYP